MNLMEFTGKILIEKEGGALETVKRVLLVEGDTFTELEAVANEWLNSNTNYQEQTIIEGIKRVKYSSIYHNDTLSVDEDKLMGLTEYTPTESHSRFWELTVQFDEETDKGKIKSTKEKFIMPAETQKEAITRLEAEMSECMMSWKVVNGKETVIYACLVNNDAYGLVKLKNGLIGSAEEFENAK